MDVCACRGTSGYLHDDSGVHAPVSAQGELSRLLPARSGGVCGPGRDSRRPLPPQRSMYITINRGRYRKCRDFTEVMPLLKRSRSAKNFEAFAMYTERIRGKKVAVIGHFPNFQKKWESICELSILEMQPEWGDYPAEAAEFLCQQDHATSLGTLQRCCHCVGWSLRAHAPVPI